MRTMLEISRELASIAQAGLAFTKDPLITFLCELIGGEARTNIETTAVAFFPLDAHPPLDPGRTSEAEIRRARSCSTRSSRRPSTERG